MTTAAATQFGTMYSVATALEEVLLIPMTNVKTRYATNGKYNHQPIGLTGK
jgi:hypothetical protein